MAVMALSDVRTQLLARRQREFKMGFRYADSLRKTGRNVDCGGRGERVTPLSGRARVRQVKPRETAECAFGWD